MGNVRMKKMGNDNAVFFRTAYAAIEEGINDKEILQTLEDLAKMKNKYQNLDPEVRESHLRNIIATARQIYDMPDPKF